MTNFTVFLVLITIVCFLLIIVIMVQNPKGGGLSSSFDSSTSLGGVQKTTDFLDKSTWTLATALIVLILLSNLGKLGGNESKVLDESKTVAPKTEKAAIEKPATGVPAKK